MRVGVPQCQYVFNHCVTNGIVGGGVEMVVIVWDELGEEMLELQDCVLVWLVVSE